MTPTAVGPAEILISTGSGLKAKYAAPEKFIKRKKHIKVERQMFECISSGPIGNKRRPARGETVDDVSLRIENKSSFNNTRIIIIC